MRIFKILEANNNKGNNNTKKINLSSLKSKNTPPIHQTHHQQPISPSQQSISFDEKSVNNSVNNPMKHSAKKSNK